MNDPQIISFTDCPVTYTLLRTLWIPSSAKILALGTHHNRTGIIEIFEVADTIKSVQKIEKGIPIKCGTFGLTHHDNKLLFCGDFEGNVLVWDINNLNEPIYEKKGHEGTVNCVDGFGGECNGHGPAEAATGGVDGVIKIWDLRTKNGVVAIMKSLNVMKRDCWTVAIGNSYNSEERVVCAGFDNGDIKLFDLKMMAVRWEANVKSGICSVEFDKPENKLNRILVTTVGASFHVFQAEENPEMFSCVSEKAHGSTIWVGRHYPQNSDLFMTCGGSGSLSLWKYHSVQESDDTEDIEHVKLLSRGTISTQPIYNFEWCRNKAGLALTASFDQIIRLVIVTKLNLC